VKAKVYPLLAQKIIRARKARAYRAWTALRMFEEAKQGWLPLTPARKHLMKMLRMTESGVTRLLRAGEGDFWIISKKKRKLSLRGLRRLRKEFEVEQEGGVEIPDEALGRLQTFKAYCYDAFFRKRKELLSREELKRLYGVSLDTILLWEKILEKHLRKTKNFGVADKATYSGSLPRFFWETQGQYIFQLPNSYALSSRDAYTDLGLKERRRGQWRPFVEGDDHVLVSPVVYWTLV